MTVEIDLFSCSLKIVKICFICIYNRYLLLHLRRSMPPLSNIYSDSGADYVCMPLYCDQSIIIYMAPRKSNFND